MYAVDGNHGELGFNHYSHSTSPLRRFADLWNRYLISVFKNKKVSEEKIKQLEEETARVVSELNSILDRHEYFTIEYNKKVKQLK